MPLEGNLSMFVLQSPCPERVPGICHETHQREQDTSEKIQQSIRNFSKKQRRGADEDKLGYKSEVIRWAKRFLFTQALCINVTAFQAKPADTLDPTQPEDQFASDDVYVQSITAALYQEIPEKFHSLFIHDFGEGHSSLLNVLQKLLPVILNGANIDMSLLTTAGADRSNNTVLTALLCFPNEQKPLLYPSPVPWSDAADDGYIHRTYRDEGSPSYFGPKSLTGGKKPASNSNGKAFRTINKFVFAGLTPNATARNLNAVDGTENIAELLRQFELGAGPVFDPEEDEVVIAQPRPVPDEPVEDHAVPAQVHVEEPPAEAPIVPEGHLRRTQRVVAVPAGRGRGARGTAKQRGSK
ncbi:hypothetical protein B0H17DRAFT_1133607 [Mycena rosella]|uniref:Uncharacterized protein n=1 Tax=Mycena rosella TaxID=1033263 RepID=A0AAD7GEZ1_MYCRO|nr:hypothetical protein B0H17DRAFT_1133607 [Mycena rosella]